MNSAFWCPRPENSELGSLVRVSGLLMHAYAIYELEVNQLLVRSACFLCQPSTSPVIPITLNPKPFN